MTARWRWIYLGRVSRSGTHRGRRSETCRGPPFQGHPWLNRRNGFGWSLCMGPAKMESSGTTNLGDWGAPGSGGRGHRGYGRFGSDGGWDESPGSAVATASPGYVGAGAVTPPRRDAGGHGGLRAPGTRLSNKGTRVAPQIVTEARDKDGGLDRRNVPWSPDSVLIDTVARLQRDLADTRVESQFLHTPGVPPVVPTPRHVAFTSTKVPRFAGMTSWEQYRQVFDAIVLSNGWDDATVAL